MDNEDMTASTTTFKIHGVGGFIRDEFLGVKSKDEDFAVEVEATDIDHAFARLLLGLARDRFEIFLVDLDHVTVRARFPRDHPNHGRTTADFVLCRKDGPSSDGRHPDFVEVGTIEDDLARRDFTVNAIARSEDGTLIDPHGGVRDIETRTLRAVGDAMTRFREDGLRVLRALRFVITKGFTMDAELAAAVRNPETATLLAGVSTERVRDELFKMFAKDTLGTLDLLGMLPEDLRRAIFRDGLKLKPTQEDL